MQCKNVEKTTFIIFTQFNKIHTQSFTIPQFPKIGLTHKNSPQWSRQLSQPTLWREDDARLTGASFKEGKCTESPPTLRIKVWELFFMHGEGISTPMRPSRGTATFNQMCQIMTFNSFIFPFFMYLFPFLCFLLFWDQQK